MTIHFNGCVKYVFSSSTYSNMSMEMRRERLNSTGASVDRASALPSSAMSAVEEAMPVRDAENDAAGMEEMTTDELDVNLLFPSDSADKSP